ncbi:MAG: hypothetical protein AAGA16_17715, partial [Cyanobacteria bacterium P01_E01_bin.35]
PRPIPQNLQQLGREVIQGYFLTISNLSNRDVDLVITFRILSDPDDPSDPSNPGEIRFTRNNVSAFWDFNGKNESISFTPQSPRRRNYTIELPAQDTGLLIVQPNPRKIDTNPVSEIEIRGFVEVSEPSNVNGDQINILLTPEHRGTFFKRVTDPGGTTTGFEQLDQIVYSLPTANGGSLFSL